MADIPPKPWPTGIAETCEPLVRRILAPNPSPYTFTGTETYLVGAGQEVAVIDPGPAGAGFDGHADTHGAGHVEAILAAIGEARLVAILCTHTQRPTVCSRMARLSPETAGQLKPWRRPGTPRTTCATRCGKAAPCSPATT
jgi:hypothetical protein